MTPYCGDYLIRHYRQIISECRERHMIFVTIAVADLEGLLERIRVDSVEGRTKPPCAKG